MILKWHTVCDHCSNVNGVGFMASLGFLYLIAKSRVVESGYGDEIRWQTQIQYDHIDERTFLREMAWVILSSGMRESVIRNKFQSFSQAFCDWESARVICLKRSKCASRAMAVFGHKGKVAAILNITHHIDRYGFDSVRLGLEVNGPEYLMQFPYLGQATAFHLAKNLGLDVVKPDRHLIRAAAAACFESPELFCDAIAKVIGDRLAVIDIVVWRFATIEPQYEAFFAKCGWKKRGQAILLTAPLYTNPSSRHRS